MLSFSLIKSGGSSFGKLESQTVKYRKHIDASVKERPQTPLVPSEEIVSVFYAINIFNTVFYTINIFNTIFLVYHDLTKKIRCIDAPEFAFTHRNLPESEKYI